MSNYIEIIDPKNPPVYPKSDLEPEIIRITGLKPNTSYEITDIIAFHALKADAEKWRRHEQLRRARQERRKVRRAQDRAAERVIPDFQAVQDNAS